MGEYQFAPLSLFILNGAIKERSMKTLICVPCMDQVASGFAQSLAMLRKTDETAISFLCNSLVYDARNKMALQAIQYGADRILWIDSDMTFEPDLMERLSKRIDEGCDIVSGLCFRRAVPFTPVIVKGYDENGKAIDYLDYPENKLIEVEAVGMACTMMKTSILTDIALETGGWYTPIVGYGEDYSFCQRAKSVGKKIFVDTSIKVGHIGHLVIDETVYKTMR